MALELKKVIYKKIIKEIDCEFNAGEIYTIISSDEIEKDIFGRLIVGQLKGYSGEIINSRKDKIGYVPLEDKTILMDNTVNEELLMRVSNHNKETINKRFKSILKMLDLDKNIGLLKIEDISDGERKLVEIGCVLMTNPKVLVLNEPTLNLDDYHKDKLIRLLKKISVEYKKTIIIMTSDILLAYQVCDKYILLRKGKIIEKASKKGLLNITDKLIKSSLDFPKIIEFINMANKKGASLTITYDVKELMKDIYRNAN